MLVVTEYWEYCSYVWYQGLFFRILGGVWSSGLNLVLWFNKTF